MTLVVDTPVCHAVPAKPDDTAEAAPASTREPVPGIIERLGGSTVLENPYIRVDTDMVRFPNGAMGHYSVVTSGSGLGVIAIPFLNFRGNLHLGLVRQYRYPLGQVTLEFPRGGSDNLSLDEAARELIEETGLSYTSGVHLGTLRPDTGLLTTEVAVWKTFHRMEHLRPGFVEDETGARVEWYSLGKVDGLIRNGQITCGMTLAALTLLRAGDGLNCP